MATTIKIKTNYKVTFNKQQNNTEGYKGDKNNLIHDEKRLRRQLDTGMKFTTVTAATVTTTQLLENGKGRGLVEYIEEE